LVAHDETTTIHGFECRLYTMRVDHVHELQLWLTDSPQYPPFFLLTTESPLRFHISDPVRDWPHTVRSEGLFPLLVELRTSDPEGVFGASREDTEFARHSRGDSGAQPVIRARWEVHAIEHAAPDPELFEIPGIYLQITSRY
ncbi:MAG: hypothetical protein EA425_08545, partial [Puniceicoccaceae bacterium]